MCFFADDNSACSLNEVLIFATGADRIPPLGFFPRPSIAFSQESRYPTAKACANILTLPTAHDSYVSFKESMDFGILNSPGFGVA